MGEPSQPPSQSPPLPEGVLSALINVLPEVVERLKKQFYLFVIGIGVLIVLAFIASLALETFIPLYVTIGALVVLALAALGLEAIGMSKSRPTSETEPEGRTHPQSDAPIPKPTRRQKGQAQVSSVNLKEKPLGPQTLLKCLEKRFRPQDLKKVHFLMGIGYDDLVGGDVGKTEKAMALIEYVEARERLPELLAAMREVYPGLEC